MRRCANSTGGSTSFVGRRPDNCFRKLRRICHYKRSINNAEAN